jgi:hypothetical protein
MRNMARLVFSDIGRVGVCVLLLCSLRVPAFSQAVSEAAIKVMLMDAQSGKPLRNVPLTLESWNGPPNGAPDNPAPRGIIQTHTDTMGRVSFRLSNPIPKYVGFIGLGYPNFRNCSPTVFSVNDALKVGVVAPFSESKEQCGKLNARTQISPKAGEIIIYERPLTRGDWFRQELP